MTSEQDIVLVYFEDQPAFFARIEDISSDVKKDWYQVKLFMLQIPLQTVTWILRDIYIDGQEFTMGGNRVRLEKVTCPETPPPEDDQTEDKDKGPVNSTGHKNSGKVISFSDLKK